MKIIKSKLPEKSILNKEVYDYMDSFRSCFIDKEHLITTTHIGKSFFTSGPKWIDKLFALRNYIVKIFGLKVPNTTKDRQQQIDMFNCNPGDQLGLFKVYEKNENEIILGEDDKHLNFRVSLLIDDEPEFLNKRNLTITTTVKFNNWFGKLYFLPVRLFHKIIVPAMLKQLIKNLETKGIYGDG